MIQMSDQSGFASGGTSAVWTVEESAQGIPLCFDQSRNESQPWDFDISPQSADSSILISCGSYTLEWNTGDGVVTGCALSLSVGIQSGTLNRPFHCSQHSELRRNHTLRRVLQH